MLKRLFNHYKLSLEPIIIKEYKRLHLTQEEAWLLIALFNFSTTKETFSLKLLQNNFDYTPEQLDTLLQSLYTKGFYSLALVKKNNKAMEHINLDQAFLKLETLIQNDIKEDNLKEATGLLEKAVLMLEKTIQKPLTTLEYNRLKELVSNNLLTDQNLITNINKLSTISNPCFNYFEKIYLNGQKLMQEVKISAEKEAEIIKLFKGTKE